MDPAVWEEIWDGWGLVDLHPGLLGDSRLLKRKVRDDTSTSICCFRQWLLCLWMSLTHCRSTAGRSLLTMGGLKPEHVVKLLWVDVLLGAGGLRLRKLFLSGQIQRKIFTACSS